MRALLLAAGPGSRLEPLTLSKPKCLVDIEGQPLLERWLQMLHDSKLFSQIYINTHHLATQVNGVIKNSPYADRVTLSYEPELLGSTRTLLQHEHALSNEDFLVAHADNLSVIDWSSFTAAHNLRPAHAVGTMMTFVTDDPQSCGIVETDRDGTLITMHEKVTHPPGNLANAAIYLFNPVVFEIFRNRLTQPLSDISRDLIPLLHGRLTTFLNDIYHRDIGTLDSLNAARADFSRRPNQLGV